MDVSDFKPGDRVTIVAYRHDFGTDDLPGWVTGIGTTFLRVSLDEYELRERGLSGIGILSIDCSPDQLVRRDHACVERDVSDGGTMKYQGHIAAPGYGVAYRCVECDAPRVRLGQSWIDPRESEPIELQPWDVI